MIIEDGRNHELALDFKRHGGKITYIRDKSFLIEVSTGSFYIHQQYVMTK